MQQKERRSSYPLQQHGTGEHYAKWNKPGGERQIPYDLTFKWNLISKTNKQVKYNERHWNWTSKMSFKKLEVFYTLDLIDLFVQI